MYIRVLGWSAISIWNLFPKFRWQINHSLTIEAETAFETLEIRSISTWLIAGEDRITLDTVQRRLLVTVVNNKSIHSHQFGFRQRHSTIDQTHRVIQKVNQAFDSKQYCSAEFLDTTRSLLQSLAYWTLIQVENISPPELFYHFKILLA
jgi:hypothetical protein